MKILEEKRFSLPISQASFRFISYEPKSQMMLGELIFDEKTQKFIVNIPKSKAREYKYNPDLLALEVQIRATLNGKKVDRIIFHEPGDKETYTAIIGANTSD